MSVLLDYTGNPVAAQRSTRAVQECVGIVIFLATAIGQQSRQAVGRHIPKRTGPELIALAEDLHLGGG